jgi:hypothetical protein
MTSTGLTRSVLRGAAAGAAGTTALNAATYLDMVLRARPASSTPQETVEKGTDALGVEVPGEGEDKDNRTSALGALTGLATGVAVGAAYGLVRGLGLRPPALVGAGLTAGVALVGANGPMAALGVSDPRTWSTSDWVADLVPHVAYGLVTAFSYPD